MNKYVIKVENISCTNCTRTITNAIMKKWPNSKVNVSITTQTVYVLGMMDQSDVENLLRDINYPPIISVRQNTFRKKYSLKLAIIILVIFILGMLNHYKVFEWLVPDFLNNPILHLTLASIMQFYLAVPFYKGAYSGIQNKTYGMDFLIVFSTTIAYLFSIYLLFQPMSHESYFEVSAAIIAIVMIGKSIEERTKQKTHVLLDKLQDLIPNNLRLINGEIVDVDFVHIGDKYMVYPGEKIAVDGRIIKGSSFVDESNFTGESKPINKQINNRVIGGSINLSNELTIEVDRSIDNNMLNQIIATIEQASLNENKYQKLADKVANLFVPLVLAISALTFVITFIITGDAMISFEHAITVIVISCPCSLGLATPTSIMVSSSISAKEGILYQGTEFFENAHKIDTICFDKTGTLTESTFKLSKYNIPSNYNQIIKSIHQKSTHPISKTISKFISEEGFNLDVVEQAGIGLTAINNGVEYQIGGSKILKENIPEIKKLEQQNYTVNVFLINGKYIGYYALRAEIKSNVKDVIKKIKAMHIKPVMITGDNENVAKQVALEIGIEDVYANVMPNEKCEVVTKYQQDNKIVAYVGDGINDSVALKQADLGISVFGGTDIAKGASDAVLLDDDISLILKGIEIAKLTRKNILRNFAWAFSYNIIAIPLAAFGMLNMIFAAIFMGFSSIIVVLNALHLKREYKNSQK